MFPHTRKHTEAFAEGLKTHVFHARFVRLVPRLFFPRLGSLGFSGNTHLFHSVKVCAGRAILDVGKRPFRVQSVTTRLEHAYSYRLQCCVGLFVCVFPRLSQAVKKQRETNRCESEAMNLLGELVGSASGVA